MKFVADENFPMPSVLGLRNAGLDVLSVQQSFEGIEDPEVLDLARFHDRIVLTFDLDFGDLIFYKGEVAPIGIVLLRFEPNYPREPFEILTELLHTLKLDGMFTVVSRNKVRQRELPNKKI